MHAFHFFSQSQKYHKNYCGNAVVVTVVTVVLWYCGNAHLDAPTTSSLVNRVCYSPGNKNDIAPSALHRW